MSILRNKKFTVIVIAIMAFIFFQSALPADLSSQESGRVVDLIIRLFQDILPLDRQTMVFIVRKGAHFTEYTILGGFLVPAVNVPGRSCELRDIVIDSCGVLAGVLVVSLAIWSKKRRLLDVE